MALSTAKSITPTSPNMAIIILSVIPKPAKACLLYTSGGFRKKTGGIDLGTTSYLQPNIKTNQISPISQSATLTALFTKESLALRIVHIKPRPQTNIPNLHISLGSTVQGELAALAV